MPCKVLANVYAICSYLLTCNTVLRHFYRFTKVLMSIYLHTLNLILSNFDEIILHT
ncbi:hypothetical protein HanIR_Chr13g0650801 [Helianthus annuus]|nr:hypothetical protein HanIR_Chr13g0650801 [Helianthus annuus]